MKTLVIGGSGGIGSSLCALLTAAGHETHATYFKNRTAVEASGAVPISLDMGSDASLRAAAERIEREAYEGLVLLAAESAPREFFVKSDPTTWAEYVHKWLRGYSLLTHAFGASARARKTGGSVVYVLSSVVLGLPPEKQSAYVTLKYALLGLAKSQSAEWLRYGVRVNSVSPGMTQTAFISDLPERFVQTYAETLPAGRLAAPEEVASAVRFLLSEEAAYISGANLPVAGAQAC